MNQKDKMEIKRLAKEGKTIATITAKDYPECDYWDIYQVVYGGGGRSAIGVKRVISNRLKRLGSTKKKAERDMIIQEIEDLVWNIYNRLKSNQQKLYGIRNVLNK
ncbi:MAG: hypothetical protein KAJ46_04975 [Sedimentisphaerales bacterium]|nr:hypothetical protein [Sedimentisphaerales bacterium]